MSQTAIRLDCDACDGTGWENLFSTFEIPAYFRSGSVKTWNYESGTLDYFGDCSIKISYEYKEILDRADHILMDDIRWTFSAMREPGESFGQKRMVVALSRR